MIVGFTCGAFDLLHPGHIFMLAECKKQCDRLIVGLQTNPKYERPWKNAPVQSVYERYVQLFSCRHVDSIIPYDTEADLVNIMGTLTINKRFVGIEYLDTEITGQDVCEDRDIEIVYTERHHNYSSSELRGRLK